MPYDISDTQLAAIRQLQAAFPAITDPAELVEGPLAQWALGPLPPWSNLPRHQLAGAQTANVGAGVMCLFLEGVQQEPWIYLGQRPHPRIEGAFLYNGSGGGFGNLRLSAKDRAKLRLELGIDAQEGEQPKQTAAREWAEENRDCNNNPLFLLRPEQLKQVDLDEGIDYAAMRHGFAPTAFSVFHTFLSDEQVHIAKAHAAALEDENYRLACMQHTGNETSHIRLLPLAEAAQLDFADFAYAHELKAVRRLQTLHLHRQLVL